MKKDNNAEMKKSYNDFKERGRWRGDWKDFERYGYEFLKMSEACSDANTLEEIKKARKLLDGFVKKFKKDREVMRSLFRAIQGSRMTLASARRFEERKDKLPRPRTGQLVRID